MIVCGVDFSEQAHGAARAAAAIARLRGVALRLVHVVDETGAEATFRAHADAVYDPIRHQLDDLARQLAAEHRVEVQAVVGPGHAARGLAAAAEEAGASELVVAATGASRGPRWLLGSVAEQIVRVAATPTLIVRDPDGLVAWGRGERPLKVVAGVEPTESSRPALRWIGDLAAVGRCEIVVAQLVWPAAEHERLGLRGPMPLDQLRPEVQEVLDRALAAWTRELLPDREVRRELRLGWGRVDHHLAAVAAEHDADLLVVGSHQRGRAGAARRGAIARGVVHLSRGNVAVVPRRAAADWPLAARSYEAVVAATDLTDRGNRAIAHACALVAAGGTVHVVHVAVGGDPTGDLAARIAAAAPPPDQAPGIQIRAWIVDEQDVPDAICHAAARLGADAICMATRGRSAVAQTLVGSKAQAVLRRAHLPVLLVPPERDE